MREGWRTQRLLSWLVSLSMVLSLVPPAAVAEMQDELLSEDAPAADILTDDEQPPSEPVEDTPPDPAPSDDAPPTESPEPEPEPQPEPPFVTAQATSSAHITTLMFSHDGPISDGTAPWDSEEGDGKDFGATNLIVRTHDTITYNISANVGTDNGESITTPTRIGFRVTIPQENELKLDKQAMAWMQDHDEATTTIDGKPYVAHTFYCTIPPNNGVYAPGGVTIPVVLDVGALPKGYEISPKIEAWCEGDDTILSLAQGPDATTSYQARGAGWDTNMPTIVVTTAPALNVVLAGRSNASALTSINFAEKPEGKAGYTNASGTIYNSDKGTVQGFEATFAMGVEVRNSDLNKAMRGVEMPDPTKPISFDIDLKSLYRKTGDADFTAMPDSYTPLLRCFKKNGEDNDYLGDLPLYSQASHEARVSCEKSGDVTVEQNGSTLHVTIAGGTFANDPDKWPSSAPSKAENAYKIGDKYTDGFFSTYYFKVVIPIADDTQDLRDDLNAKFTVMLDATVKNLSATSVSGVPITNQTVTTDDEQRVMRELESTGGRHDQEIFFSRPNNWTEGTHDGAKDKDDGTDYLAIGSKSTWSVIFHEDDVATDDVGSHVVAYDQLVKFDNKAISVAPDDVAGMTIANGNADDGANNPLIPGTRANTEGTNWHMTALYAYKQDGTGWTSDEELRSAEERDLVYSSTYDPTRACVGILYQWRGANLTSSTEFSKMATTAFRINPNNDLINKAYMLTAHSNAWTANDLKAQAEAAWISRYGEGNVPTSGLTLDQYRQVMQGQDGLTAPDHAALMATTNSVNVDRDKNYVKATYNENGYQGGETAGFLDGDTMYVISYVSHIAKSVAQRGSLGINEPKQSYQLDYGQRVADYRIDSSLDFGNVSTADITKGSWPTNVTITDTLPKGLNYLTGTSVYTYNPSTYREASPSATDAGTVSDPDAVKLEPTVTKNADGTTTLVWWIPNVDIYQVVQNQSKFPSIFYSCFIGDTSSAENDVQADPINGATLDNVATIRTSDDNRKASVVNGNMADAKITWSRLAGFNMYKSATPAIEADGTGTYVISVNNSSNNAVTNILAVDLLPYAGTKRTVTTAGSAYKITSATLDVDLLGGTSMLDDVTVWYYPANGPNAGTIRANASELKRADVTTDNGWVTAELDKTNGSVTGFLNSWPVAIAYLDDSIDAGKSAKITLGFEGTYAQKGDHLVNALMMPDRGLEVDATTDAYTRSIEGTAWLDHDNDGVLGTGDTLLPHIQATLYRVNDDGTETPVQTTRTDDKGHYAFGVMGGLGYDADAEKILHAGEYKVVFTYDDDDNDNNSPKYTPGTVSPVAKATDVAGNVSEADKALALGTDPARMVITGIQLPTIGEMREKEITTTEDGRTIHHYNLPEQNVAYRVNRKLEGLVWEDANHDGVRADAVSGSALGAEQRISGVTVMVVYPEDVKDSQGNVVHKAGDVVQDVLGNSCVATTAADGAYHFENMPEGTYDILFSGEPLRSYAVTAQNVGSDDTIDSDAADDGGSLYLQRARISRVTMPSDLEIIRHEKEDTVSHQDLGLYQFGQLFISKVVEGESASTEDFTRAFEFQITITDANGRTVTGEFPAFVSGEDYVTHEDYFAELSIQSGSTFTLKHGYTLVVINVPVGAFAITEINSTGYAVKHQVGRRGVQEEGPIARGNVEAETEYEITFTNDKEATSFSVTKVWDDESNAQNSRLNDEAFLRKWVLYKGNNTDTVTGITPNLTKVDNNKWTLTWAGLPKYDANGNEIAYFAVESQIAGYNAPAYDNADTSDADVNNRALNGGKVTNTLSTAERTEVEIQKLWEDYSNAGKRRPTTAEFINAIKVYYLTESGDIGEPVTKEANGGEDITVDIDSNHGNTWVIKFGNLKTFEDDSHTKRLHYTFREDDVPAGYTPTRREGSTIVNTLTDTPAKTVTFTKRWNDGGQSDLRPVNVALDLYNDRGDKVNVTQSQPKRDDAHNVWTFTYDDLPAYYDDGTEISYYAVEAQVGVNSLEKNGYVPDAERVEAGGTLTNTLTTSVGFTKVWHDYNDTSSRPRADSYASYLELRTGTGSNATEAKDYNGSSYTPTVVDNDNGTYTVTYRNLPMYDKNGQRIAYTIHEKDVASYRADRTDVGDAGSITNTLQTSVSITKTWDDNGDVAHARPTANDYKASVNLYAGNVLQPHATKTVTDNGDNTYTVTFSGIDKFDESGTLIAYSVRESALTGYRTRESTASPGGGITNSYERTSASVTKLWSDGSYLTDQRPSAGNLPTTLWRSANGGSTWEQVADEFAGTRTVSNAVTGSDSWTITYSDLPRYVRDTETTEYLYAISEGSVPKYQASYANSNGSMGTTVDPSDNIVAAQSGGAITNTPATTDVTVTKVWDIGNDAAPSEQELIAKLHLYAGGREVATTTPTVTGSEKTRTVTYSGLPAYDSVGNAIVYTVCEDAWAGYVTTGSPATNGGTITNTKSTSVTATKVWDDGNNRDGKRTSVTFQLMKRVDASNAVVVEGSTRTLASGDARDQNLTTTWTDLPLYEDGKPVTYEVAENPVPAGYTQATTGDMTNGFVVTNSHEYEVTSVSITKVWDDTGNNDGKRPGTSVYATKVHLMDGNEEAVDDAGNRYTPAVKDNGNNTYTVTYSNIPAKSGGQPITYRIKEDAISGYQTTQDWAEHRGSITNRHENDLTSVTATKVWDDNNNQDGKRPPYVTFHLMKSVGGGEATKVEGQDKKIASSATGAALTVTWYNLNAKENGEDITYSVTEDAIPGYNEGSDGVDGRPTIVKNPDGSLTITNKHTPETTSISVTKRWFAESGLVIGTEDFKSKVILYANGMDVSERHKDGLTVTSNNATMPTYTITYPSLPTYQNGVKQNYTIGEAAMDNFATSYSAADGSVVEGSVDNGGTITNTQLTTAWATKQWDDNSNQDGLRSEVTFRLLQQVEGSGEKTSAPYAAQKVATGTDNSHNMEAVWRDLPLYDLSGKKLTYFVQEVSVPGGYVTNVADNTVASGGTIINTHTPEKVSLTFTKRWVDNNDQDGKRVAPGNFASNLKLLADGADANVNPSEVKDNGDNTYTITYNGLPKFSAGHEIVYTLSEPTVPADYTSSGSPAAVGGAIVNTHTPEKTSLTVTKKWVDGSNQDGIRPASVTVQVKRTVESDTSSIGTVTLAAEHAVSGDNNAWTYTIDDLPVYVNGKAATYTVEEQSLPNGYSVTTTGNMTDGYTITNTHVLDTTDITVTKVWDDNSNSDDKRPRLDGFKKAVRLYANGTDVTSTYENKLAVTQDTANTNQYVVKYSGLPKNANGRPITYAIGEELALVPGYTSGSTVAGNGGSITNKHDPDTTQVTITKTWDDDNNRDGLRPTASEYVSRLTLLADGHEVADAHPSVVDNGTYTNGKGSYTISYANLKKNRDGNTAVPIVYTVAERDVDGYTATYQNVSGATVEATEGAPDNGTIVNKHDIAKTEVTIKKVWRDSVTEGTNRPAPDKFGDYLELQYEDGTVVASGDYTCTVQQDSSDNDTYVATFSGMPKYRDGGMLIRYRVRETDVPGYEAVGDQRVYAGGVLTNEDALTSISLIKRWDSYYDVSLRPSADELAQALTLYRVVEGEARGSVVAATPIVVTGSDDWSIDYTDLPTYWNGKKASYYVREDPQASRGFTVVYKYRPDYQNNDSGITDRAVDGGMIENQAVTTRVDVTKCWVDAAANTRPPSITLSVWAGAPTADGEPYQTETFEVIATNDTQTFSFDDLHQYDSEGNEIDWHVTEDAVSGYVTTYTDANGEAVALAAPAGGSIHNTQATSITLYKAWEGGYYTDDVLPTREDFAGWLTLHAHAEGAESDADFVVAATPAIDVAEADDLGNAVGPSLDLSACTLWSVTYKDLPAYAQDGAALSYYVTERPDERYEVRYPSRGTAERTNAVAGGLVYNLPATTRVAVTKRWVDGGSRNRPGADELAKGLRLYANGSVVTDDAGEPLAPAVEAGAAGDELTIAYGGAGSSALPAFDKAGRKIAYTVREVSVPAGYAVAYADGQGAAATDGAPAGGTLTNTLTTTVTLTKRWRDRNNADETRPAHATFTLTGTTDNGQTVAYGPKGVRLGSGDATDRNTWQRTLSVPACDADGNEIVYTVAETDVDEAYVATQDDALTWTNALADGQPTVAVEATKFWDDASDADGLRPESVTFEVYADGGSTPVQSRVLTARDALAADADRWRVTFSGLAKYTGDSDKAIVYTVRETATVAGYDAPVVSGDAAKGFEIRNPHKPAEKPGENPHKDTDSDEPTGPETGTGTKTPTDEDTPEDNNSDDPAVEDGDEDGDGGEEDPGPQSPAAKTGPGIERPAGRPTSLARTGDATLSWAPTLMAALVALALSRRRKSR